MLQFTTPYLHIQDALTVDDLNFLRKSCKQHLAEEGIPCYVLIDKLESPTCIKIKQVLERQIGERMYYLNDFYIYTDSSFKTNWHMDTELFTFDCAINAWILLSPDLVEDPLGFVDQINESSNCSFHSVRIEKDQYIFGNYCNGEVAVRSLDSVELGQIHTPQIRRGDILVLNPKRFHRTNVNIPKHVIALKFVMEGKSGFLSATQVDPCLWPEVDMFNKLVKNARDWESVVDGIRLSLKSEAGRKDLSAGFYPDQFDVYRRMVASL
jgi:hypothetical protein